MTARPFWTIKLKLLALIGAAIFCAQTLFAGYALIQEAQRYAAQKETTLSAVAQVIAAAAARATAAHDPQGVRDALRAIGRIDEVDYASVYDARGRMIAELGAAELLASDLRLNDKSPSPGSPRQSAISFEYF